MIFGSYYATFAYAPMSAGSVSSVWVPVLSSAVPGHAGTGSSISTQRQGCKGAHDPVLQAASFAALVLLRAYPSEKRPLQGPLHVRGRRRTARGPIRTADTEPADIGAYSPLTQNHPPKKIGRRNEENILT